MRVIRTLRVRARPAADPYPPPAAAEFERRIECPKCGNPMSTYAYGGPGNIVIDNCRGCMLNWLDHKEIERVATAPDESHSTEAWVAPKRLAGEAGAFERGDKVA